MSPQEILLVVAECLIKQKKIVTLDKVVAETGLEPDRASEALETLSEGGLIAKREIEDFDESCYQSTEKTSEFFNKLSQRLSAESKDEKSGAPSARHNEKTSTSSDLVEAYLADTGAPDDVVMAYKKLLKDRKYFQRRSVIWERHISKMVDDVSKDLSDLG